MRATPMVRTIAAGAAPRARQRLDAGRLSQLVPRPRQPLTWQLVADGLRDAGITILPDLPETATAPFEVHRCAGGGSIDGVALASWLADDERLVVLQSLRKMLLAHR